MTNKQKQEIDFLTLYFEAKPTQEEIDFYIQHTVHGKGTADKYHKNSIFQAKRGLDIMIKEWTRDMQDGLLAYWELQEEFNNHPYAIKVINTIRRGQSQRRNDGRI
jgi:hypothetical protein